MKNIPFWMNAIPLACGVLPALYFASTANRLGVILSIPIGFVVGFVIIAVITKNR